jgi:hypothetical protein
MGILELTVGSVIVGFFTVFGWNSGNLVWDKYIDPAPVVQSADSDEAKEKRERH